MLKPILGELETQVLRYVSDHHPIEAREVADEFGRSRNLARTTILTVLSNLMTKGFIVRSKQDGIFVYAPASPKGELLQNLVQGFVDRTLGGSVSPIVAYLDETRDISDDELARLERLVEALRAERRHE